ncbi:MAG: SIMPL domain-containing protein [Burkholderiales bacterium]|nr:SIMPL domain-containing protein [Burkholderiales bacterium]
MRLFKNIVLAGWIAVSPGLVQAHEPALRYNVVELQADAQREVQNDTMTATLFVEQNGFEPAQVADSVNKVVNQALKTAKEFGGVTVKSGYTQTYPVYGKNNQLQGWRMRSELRLETKNFAAGSKLIGKLQSSMQLAEMGFSVSDEARRKAENELVTEAIARFRERADIARQALDGGAYKIQRLSINTGGRQPIRPFLARAEARSMDVAAPDVQAGTSEVTVSANGAIEID